MKLKDVIVLAGVGALTAGVVYYLFKMKRSASVALAELPIASPPASLTQLPLVSLPLTSSSGTIILGDILTEQGYSRQKAPYYEASTGGLLPEEGVMG